MEKSEEKLPLLKIQATLVLFMHLKPQKLLSIGCLLENYDRPIWKNQIGWVLIGMSFIVIGMSRLNSNLANETILRFKE